VATYAIGDVQGCMASLERLLALIDFSPPEDRLWLVGDLVNRGPRSLDVLRWAYDNDSVITCVLGNHDLHLLARAAGAADAKKRDTLDDVLNARNSERLLTWLRHRPLIHVQHDFVLVHGGLHPQWTILDARARAAEIEHQLRVPTWRAFLDRWRAILAYLARARMLRADGRVEPDYDGPPAQAPAGLTPWFAVPDAAWRTHTILFGHWSALGLDLGSHHVALDTGCVWGRSLTALRLDDRMVFQAKSVEGAS
jgi:bis(5'-nucleosyl)-tetraphosphatase (symmetrical)